MALNLLALDAVACDLASVTALLMPLLGFRRCHLCLVVGLEQHSHGQGLSKDIEVDSVCRKAQTILVQHLECLHRAGHCHADATHLAVGSEWQLWRGRYGEGAAHERYAKERHGY
jgi:hypothetical protein